MDPLTAAFLGAIFRWAITIVIGFFVAHHIIAVDQSTYFTDGFTHKLLMALPLLAPLGWSLYAKFKNRVRFLTALEAPAGATEKSVEAKIENGMGASVKAAVPIILLACVLGAGAMTFPACGAKAVHIATVADSALYEVLSDVHAGEQAVLCGRPSCAGVTARVTASWTDAKSQAFNKQLLPAVEAGRQFNAILATVKPGAPLPPQLSGLITNLSAALTAVTADFPDGATKSAVLANIGKAQALVLNALNLVLSVKGA